MKQKTSGNQKKHSYLSLSHLWSVFHDIQTSWLIKNGCAWWLSMNGRLSIRPRDGVVFLQWLASRAAPLWNYKGIQNISQKHYRHLYTTDSIWPIALHSPSPERCPRLLHPADLPPLSGVASKLQTTGTITSKWPLPFRGSHCDETALIATVTVQWAPFDGGTHRHQ